MSKKKPLKKVKVKSTLKKRLTWKETDIVIEGAA